VIDETMVRDGQGWVMFVKNETEIRRRRNIFSSSKLLHLTTVERAEHATAPAGTWVGRPTRSRSMVCGRCISTNTAIKNTA